METLHGATIEEQLKEIEYIKKARTLSAKLKNIKIAMLTTGTVDSGQHSRPMYTFEIKDDGIIWLFISKESKTSEEIRAVPKVLLNYSNPQGDLYVTVNGIAEIIEDRAKIEELWSDRFKMWFPYGKDDPNLCLLKIRPLHAEYWDTPDLLLAQMISLVKNTLNGNPYLETDNVKLDFKDRHT